MLKWWLLTRKFSQRQVALKAAFSSFHTRVTSPALDCFKWDPLVVQKSKPTTFFVFLLSRTGQMGSASSPASSRAYSSFSHRYCGALCLPSFPSGILAQWSLSTFSMSVSPNCFCIATISFNHSASRPLICQWNTAPFDLPSLYHFPLQKLKLVKASISSWSSFSHSVCVI
jgi:hypothetical protein